MDMDVTLIGERSRCDVKGRRSDVGRGSSYRAIYRNVQ